MITRELLNKFLDGRCSPEESALLKRYFADGKMSDLNRILQEDWDEANDAVPNREIDYHRKRIWGRLREKLSLEDPVLLKEYEGRGYSGFASWKWSAAAVVSLCIMALGGFMLWKPSPAGKAVHEATIAMTEQRNEQDKPMAVSLPDGSKVILDPRSVLRYPEKFPIGERLVTLEGKAFFDVAKDSLNPFFVKTNALNVRVIGTSFNISSFMNEPAEVSVITGKVAVFLTEQKGSMILEPNERAVRLNEKSELAKMLVEQPVLIRREVLTSMFDFDETPASQVFEALEEAYDIRIRFDADLLKHCTLRARLDDQPLFVKLEMICASLGLEFKIEGTDIIISGEGCYEREI